MKSLRVEILERVAEILKDVPGQGDEILNFLIDIPDSYFLKELSNMMVAFELENFMEETLGGK